MRIEITLNQVAHVYEVAPGTLLSELLQTEDAVWLEDSLIDASLMLAAQAHGYKLTLRPAVPSRPLQELMLAPQPMPC